jgi:hypothetical protein
MKICLQMFAASYLLVSTCFGQGTILWNEGVNGPLSEIGSNPTQLGSLVTGTNTILGATQIEPTGNNWLVHEDIFTFTVANGASLIAVYLTVDKPNVGSWVGDTGFSSQVGYVANSANGDLLLQWSVSALGPGSYGMYLGNYDPQPIASIANYRLDFVVQAVPEPSTVSLLLAGFGLLGLRRWQRLIFTIRSPHRANGRPGSTTPRDTQI